MALLHQYFTNKLLWGRILLGIIIMVGMYVNLQRNKVVPNKARHILLWNSMTEPLYSFIYTLRTNATNFSLNNCFFTDDRDKFKGRLDKFDAILFSGREHEDWFALDLPLERYPHQKYIYVNVDPADTFPICGKIFKNFFNWTATYRLDSDISLPYVYVTDKDGKVLGPSRHMHWNQSVEYINETFHTELTTKQKAAAWFFNINCGKFSGSGRENYTEELIYAFDKYNLTLDIYGKCGTYKCPSKNLSQCFDNMKNDYYFYLSFEKSLNEDYVSEEVLNALRNNMVPIVLGGANYSRFLPPKSYLDARRHSPDEIARNVDQVIKNPELYRRFFDWKSQYEFTGSTPAHNICKICEALSDEKRFRRLSNYRDIRKWWHRNFIPRCAAKREEVAIEMRHVLELDKKARQNINPALQHVPHVIW